MVPPMKFFPASATGGGGSNDATEGSKEEKKKENEKQGDKIDDDDEIIVLKVDMHCEACAKKVFRALSGFPGVEDVAVDRKMNKVVVKGKTADPTNLCHRILKKTGRKAQLVSRPPDQQQPNVGIKDSPKDQEPPRVTAVVLGVRMHCQACAHIMWKRIQKIKGVESVEIDVTNDQVRVKGVIADPVALAEYVTKRTRKQASILAVEDVTDKKSDDQPEATAEKKQERVEKEDNHKSGKQLLEDDKMMRSQLYRSTEYYWSPSNYNYNYNYNYMDHNTASTSVNYHPQIFSDENLNACSIM